MGKIHRLESALIDKIAAGEVVERPVAVVKELVENSLDAGARNLEIAFERGGKRRIRVTDDGCGMSAADAPLSLERHATSKVRALEDVFEVRSFGFRGEALPSIASVSDFTLRTRDGGAPHGTEIIYRSGEEPIIRSCAIAKGTEVIVDNLFKPVPARRKFMKSDRTESAHIVQTCRLLAAANPAVSFVLIEDGRENFRSPACPDLRTRLIDLQGRTRVGRMLKIFKEEEEYRISGLLGAPEDARSTRSEMHFFVQRRPVESRAMAYAAIEACHPHLGRGRFPFLYLFLELPPAQVDVNVHPAKREVRFQREEWVRRWIMEAVSEAFRKHLGSRGLARAEHVQPVQSESDSVPVWAPPPAPVLRPAPTSSEPGIPAEQSDSPPRLQAVQPVEASTENRQIRSWKFIGVFDRQYGLFESPEGLICLNARCCELRIRFEMALSELLEGRPSSQQLMIARILEFNPLEASILGESLEFLGSLGFALAAFGRNVFRMTAYPDWIQEAQAEDLLRDILQKIREKGLEPGIQRDSVERVILLGLHRSPESDLPKSFEDWNQLADALFQCRVPLTDPLGRPTLREIRKGDLRRYFERPSRGAFGGKDVATGDRD